jgi:fatty-acyl-CoA synthase
VVLLDALPLTAVGKVFKPALRLRAIEIRLTEIARESAPQRAVRVEASDEGGRQRALVTLGGAVDEALSQQLRAALAAIAVPVEVRFG